jgi:hypothetical protein
VNVIAGIGWIAKNDYGCVNKNLRRVYTDIGSLRANLKNNSVFLYPVRGFGKYDQVSKMTCCVAALSFYDAGMSYSESGTHDVGILGTNTQGCLQSNVDFFRDFVDNGRTLGRASLFVYTLPSIPLAEAAIHFKCRGPVVYATSSRPQLPLILRRSDSMILRGESKAMLAVQASEGEAICFLLRREQDVSGETIFGLPEVIHIVEKERPLDKMIGAFSNMWREGSARSVPRTDSENKDKS